MRKDKQLAIKLRQVGKSYKTIRAELNIPLSTLSNWFAQVDWSVELRQTLIKEAGKVVGKATAARWEAWRQKFRDEATAEFPALVSNPLFITGICLYWGEGDNRKDTSVVRLVNTDSRMIALFCRFLREVAKVKEQNLRASLVLYNDLSDKECRKYWNSISNIPLSQFHKTQFIQGKHPTRRTSHGMCTIYGNQAGLKQKIITWIDLLYKYNLT